MKKQVREQQNESRMPGKEVRRAGRGYDKKAWMDQSF